jgi:hypothetical protein
MIAINDHVVLVTGSRDWSDITTIRNEFKLITQQNPSVTKWTLVHGGARGADLLAAQVAKEMGWYIISMPVTTQDWQKHGKKAGIMRNNDMIHKHKPHHAVALHLDDSPGTTTFFPRKRKNLGLPLEQKSLT